MRKLISLLLFVSLVSPACAAEPLLSRWVQMAPGGGAEARVILRGAKCPDAMIDGKTVAMQVRAAPDPDGKYPVLVCSVPLQSGVQNISVLGQSLRAPVASPRRIVVFGDTGCRITDKKIQDCTTRPEGPIAPDAWGFPVVAMKAAQLKPDLVIHVGDYLYREHECPPDKQNLCGGSPHGYNWETWSADFFAPGKPLLDAAPWVIVRGNHEECSRAGAGFLRLIGPVPFVEGAPCADHLAPYSVSLGSINLVVMDNGNASDTDAPDPLVQTYQADFDWLSKLPPGPAWLAMHHPIWGVVRFAPGVVVGGNRTLMVAEAKTGLPSNVSLMLAGHIHTFEAINYTQNLPPQLIVGEGGTKLDDAPGSLDGFTLGAVTIADGFSLPHNGFVVLTRNGDRWDVDVYDAASGKTVRNCTVASRRIDCPKQ